MSGSIGPLSAEALRDALKERRYADVKVRVEGNSSWLPAFAWDAAGDPNPPPAPPPLPSHGPSIVLPSELAEFTPKMREKLLWFVSDADGLMGPLSGEFVRAGVTSGKISPSAQLCMIASQEWVRASIVFPKVYEGTTAARVRPIDIETCAFCREPVGDTDKMCVACGERILRQAPLGIGRTGAIAFLVYAALLVVGVVVALGLRTRGVEGSRILDPVLRRVAGPERQREGAASGSLPPQASASASGSAAREAIAQMPPSARPALGDEAPGASAGARPSPAVVAGPGHLAGDVAGKLDVAPDAVDVLALPRDRIAVARKASVDVLDEKSGAPLFSIAELAALRGFFPVGEAIYGLGQGRIAIIDPVSVRAVKWLELGAMPGLLAGHGERVLALLEGEPAVAVIDASRHAEIERFRFDERVTAVGLDARAQVAVVATSDARGPRPGEDAVLIFDPSRTAFAQPIRRVYVGAAPVAVAVTSSGNVAAVALLGSAEIARVDLAASPERAPAAVTRQKTCPEPTFLAFAEASNLLLVGCRSGGALSLHDAASLAPVQRLELGGPVIGLEVAPDGRQALVVVGPPVNAVSVVDLAQQSVRRLAISDEITSVRYDRHGARAVAFSLRAHHAWVLR